MACATIIATFVFGSPTARAQAIDPNDIIRQIVPSQAGETVVKLKSTNALIVPPDQMIPAIFDFPKAIVAVSFYDESHLLTTDGMLTLRGIAEALTDPRMQGQVFQLGGFVVSTNDPVGAVRLSARRAQVAANHLTTFYGVAAARVTPVGYGVPSTPNAVTAGVGNTQIQLINLLAN